MPEAFAEYRGELDTQALTRARSRRSSASSHNWRPRASTNSPLHDSLLEKSETLATLETLQTSRASVIRSADEAVKVAPTPMRNAVLGLALGLVLGVGLAFAIDALDTRVRHASEIGSALGLTLLARIPAPSRSLQKDDQLVMIATPRDSAAEAFRMLRTNLDFARLEGD